MTEDFQKWCREQPEQWAKCVQRGRISRGIHGNVPFIVRHSLSKHTVVSEKPLCILPMVRQLWFICGLVVTLELSVTLCPWVASESNCELCGHPFLITRGIFWFQKSHARQLPCPIPGPFCTLGHSWIATLLSTEPYGLPIDPVPTVRELIALSASLGWGTISPGL